MPWINNLYLVVFSDSHVPKWINRETVKVITDDMYMEYTEADTSAIAQDLLLTAIHKFEFPRRPLDYQLNHHEEEERPANPLRESF